MAVRRRPPRSTANRLSLASAARQHRHGQEHIRAGTAVNLPRSLEPKPRHSVSLRRSCTALLLRQARLMPMARKKCDHVKHGGRAAFGERSMVTKAIARSARAAITFIIATLLIYSAIVGSLVYQGFDDAEERAEMSAIAAAKAVKIHAGWIVEVAAQALRRMDSALGPGVQPNDGSTLSGVRDALEGLPASAKAYIVAADGHTLYTTDPNFVDLDIRDREYFSDPAAGKPFFTSSLLISRLDGSEIFAFSRRLERKGVFIGVAIISFDAALLKDLLDSLDLGTDSTISIVRSDGMLVARYPPADAPLDLSQYVLFTELLPRSDFGIYTNKSPLDGVKRIVSYQSVPGTDLIALASVGTAEVIGRFWHRVWVFLVFVIPTIIGLALSAIWIIRLLQKDGRRHEELRAALATNTMLFREIHHRVKNNMQSMQSLVRMQNLPETVKTDIQLRFAAMSTVHEHMYNRDAYAALDAPAFIASIAQTLVQAYGSFAKLTLDIDPLLINHERATPLALLINEVVTNALKYADPAKPDVSISISLKHLPGDMAKLVIADNGPGFDPAHNRPGMGTKIIKGMVMQLGGSHSYAFDGGTVFSADIRIG
ncbi:cache domain-containing protein [Hoeflea sp. YIM 152468]|uniref:sensor histidine kinase n=1 Tax=Hoeflea sp. YIM 152468 TaxID=3031759 RepID=UPI0023DB1085|nr:cache domain-containing protein [Hoeflea sp. YIM 152468]MDF1608347.1 cache domain-containing protein [Hoeflea sp. YIM 152468]